MPSWIDENKGEGPWTFVKQETKLGYLNNPFWVEGDLATNTHTPCGYWLEVVAEGAFQLDAFQNDAFQGGFY